MMRIQAGLIEQDVFDTFKNDLMDSGYMVNYKQAVKKEPDAGNEEGPIEIICLVGKGLSEWENPESKKADEQSLSAQNIRVVTYQQLIKDAENSYQAYFEKIKK